MRNVASGKPLPWDFIQGQVSVVSRRPTGGSLTAETGGCAGEEPADRVGGASRPRPPTPPYVLVVYGGFLNVVTPRTCGPTIPGPVVGTTPQTSPPSPVGYWSVATDPSRAGEFASL